MIPSFLGSPVTSWNIELTSNCALACPRCTRTMQKGKYKQTEIPVSLLRERFTDEILEQTQRVLFCGAHGDPIYHSHFHDVLATFKRKENLKLTIVTNGSRRSREWWEETAAHLHSFDRVKFSIDGLRDTNHIYRQNSKWDDIENAVAALRGKVELVWKFIVFRHNEHQIETARALAKEWGFSSFSLVRSHTFGAHFLQPGEIDDPLRPSDRYVNPSVLKKVQYNFDSDDLEIDPRCRFGEYHYISAEGLYLPCCWAGNYPNYEEGVFAAIKESRNLHTYSFAEIWRSGAWQTLKQSWEEPKLVPKVCRFSCRKTADLSQWQDSFDESEAKIN